MTGDFNVTLSDNERNGGRSYDRDNSNFRDFFREMELIVPLLNDRRFTWSNKRDVTSMALLDKFLFSYQWEDKFPFSK